MRSVPTQKNRGAVIGLIAVLLILGGVSYSVPIICQHYEIRTIPVLFTAFTFIVVIAAVAVAIRYLMTGFVYTIRPRSDVEENGLEPAMAEAADVTMIRPEWLDLVVTKSQGARPGYMDCVLSLGDLLEAVPVTRKGAVTPQTVRKEHADEGFVFYDYTLTYHWQEAVECIFADGTRTVGVILEADEPMRTYLLNLHK